MSDLPEDVRGVMDAAVRWAYARRSLLPLLSEKPATVEVNAAIVCLGKAEQELQRAVEVWCCGDELGA